VSIDDALRMVRDAGWVTLREKSYRQAQERQRVAEALRAAAEREAEKYGEWARETHAEERRLRDRLTFVYGIARAHGATVEELRGSTGLLAVRPGITAAPAGRCGPGARAMTACPEKTHPLPERPASSFDQLRATGLLWLINRVALHPRGFALALEYADGDPEPVGWSLAYAGAGEPWCFPHAEEPEKFQAVEQLLDLCRLLGRMPDQTTNGDTRDQAGVP